MTTHIGTPINPTRTLTVSGRMQLWVPLKPGCYFLRFSYRRVP